MSQHMMWSLLLISLLFLVSSTAELYNVCCQQPVIDNFGTAIVKCIHTRDSEKIIINWTDPNKKNLTINMSNSRGQSEDGNVFVESTPSMVTLKIHRVTMLEKLKVSFIAKQGGQKVTIELNNEVGLYNVCCQQSVVANCDTAIVKCIHTHDLDKIIINWTDPNKEKLTINMNNSRGQSEDGKVSAESTTSSVTLKIHRVTMPEKVKVTFSAKQGNHDQHIELNNSGECVPTTTQTPSTTAIPVVDPNVQKSSSHETERSTKAVAIPVLVVLAVVLIGLSIAAYKKKFRRWKFPNSRGSIFSQTSLVSTTEDESYMENPTADTALNPTTEVP